MGDFEQGLVVLFVGISLAHSMTLARQEATTRARMEKIAADAELYTIAHREYPALVARDATGVGRRATA